LRLLVLAAGILPVFNPRLRLPRDEGLVIVAAFAEFNGISSQQNIDLQRTFSSGLIRMFPNRCEQIEPLDMRFR
jgi:hypothetical protein